MRANCKNGGSGKEQSASQFRRGKGAQSKTLTGGERIIKMTETAHSTKTLRLFDAARGISGDYLRDVVVPFAFFLLLRWAEDEQREESAIAAFEDRDYQPQIPDEFSWSQIQFIYTSDYESENFRHFFRHVVSYFRHNISGAEGAARIIAQAAQAIDAEHFDRQPNTRLLREICRTIDEFSTRAFHNEMPEFFDRLVSEAVKQTRFAGEFYSPPNITELMLEIAEPKPGEKIYDPCFGTANFLAGAGKRMLNAAADSPAAWEQVKTNGIYGIELNPTAFLIGLTRTILAGISQPNLVLGNALERNGAEARPKFDIILAAPPIGSHSSHRRLFNHFPIKAHSLENFFVQHIAAHLAPNGRAIVAMPEGFLFRGGADFRLRKYLLENFCVEGIISLPEGSFAPFTMVKPNLVVFKRGRPAHNVWFQQIEAVPQKIGDKSVIFDAQEEARIFKRRQQPVKKDSPLYAKAKLNSWSAQPEFDGWTEKIKSASAEDRLWKISVATLEAKEFDLSVKKPEVNKVKIYIKRLQEKFPQLEVVKLKDLSAAEIISGVSYTRQNTDDRPADTSVPLIRVTELSSSGEIKTPSRFVSEHLLRRSVHKRLKTGDIILSTQGTIGKVGRVTEAIDGAIPAHGITIIRLRNEQINPVYFMNLLQFPAYQAWLKSESVGATIMNLPIKRLEELPIPVISSDLQQKIAAVYLEEGKPIDILEYLGNLEDVLEIEVLFLGDSLLDQLINTGFDEENLEFEIQELAEKLNDWTADIKIKNDLFLQPLKQLKNIAQKLADSFSLPEDIVRFGFLQIILDDIEKFKQNEIIRNSLAEQRRKVTGWSVPTSLLKLALAIQKVIPQQSRKLLYKGNIDISVEPSIAVLYEDTEFTVKVTNNYPLPVRDFVIEVGEDPDDSWSTKINLEPKKTEEIFLLGTPEETEFDTLPIKWRAIQFDDTIIDGEYVHRFQVVLNKTSSDQVKFGENPYIVGSPLQPDKNQQMFFGRQEIINEIKRTLRSRGESTVLLMEGNRRAGKTSILNQLQQPEILPNWVPVYFSMQEAEGSTQGNGISTEEIFYTLTKKIVLALHRLGYEFEVIGVGRITTDLSSLKLKSVLREKMRPEFEKGKPFELLDAQIEELQKVVGEKRILLMLDEFDKVHEGIQSGVTSSIVPENLRALLHKHSHISAILTGAKRIKRLRENYFSALYGLGIPIEVNALDENSARRLITEPVEDRLLFQTDAREKIIGLTKCQPYLIQSLCSRIFDECAETKERVVTQKIVETATETMTADNEHFKTLFEFIPTLRGRYIACLINDLEKSADRITFDLVSEKLLEAGIQHKPKELDEDLKSLRELDVLELENNSYRIKLPLFGKWLEKNEDIISVQKQAAEE